MTSLWAVGETKLIDIGITADAVLRGTVTVIVSVPTDNGQPFAAESFGEAGAPDDCGPIEKPEVANG